LNETLFELGLGVSMLSLSSKNLLPRAALGGACLALAGLFTIASPREAHASSPGCTAVNGGALDFTNEVGPGAVFTTLSNVFEQGEVLTATASGNVVDKRASVVAGIAFLSGPGVGSGSFTVPATGTLDLESEIEGGPVVGASINWACAPVAGATPASEQQATAQTTAEQVGQAVQEFNDPTQLPGVSYFSQFNNLVALTGVIVQVAQADAEVQRIENRIITLRRRENNHNLNRLSVQNDLETETDPEKRADLGRLFFQSVSQLERARSERIQLEADLPQAQLAARIARARLVLLLRDAGVAEGQIPSNYAALGNGDGRTLVDNTFDNFNLTAFDGGLRGRMFSNPTDTDIPLVAFARGSVTLLTGASDGEIGTGQAGLAAQLNRNLVMGAFLLGTVGTTESNNGTQTTETDTSGFGGGAYARYSFGARAGANLSISYVGTDNDMAATAAAGGVTTGNYHGSTLHLTGSVGNTYDIQDYALTLSAGATYLANKTDAYVDSNGTAVAGSTRESLTADFGAKLTRQYVVARNGILIINPFVSLDARVFASDDGDTISAGRVIFAQEAANFSLGAGTNIGFYNGGSLDLGVNLNNVASDSESVTLSGRFNIPLGGQ
jgi:hypothetical protein